MRQPGHQPGKQADLPPVVHPLGPAELSLTNRTSSWGAGHNSQLVTVRSAGSAMKVADAPVRSPPQRPASWPARSQKSVLTWSPNLSHSG